MFFFWKVLFSLGDLKIFLGLDEVVQPKQIAVSKHSPTTAISRCTEAEDHKVFSASRITGVQEIGSL